MNPITDPSWHPPHPLGLSDHPAWAAVRQRRAELEAMQAQNVPAPHRLNMPAIIAAVLIVAAALVVSMAA